MRRNGAPCPGRLLVTIDESGHLSIAAGPPHIAASLLTAGSLPLRIERDHAGAVTEGSGQFRRGPEHINWDQAPTHSRCAALFDRQGCPTPVQ